MVLFLSIPLRLHFGSACKMVSIQHSSSMKDVELRFPWTTAGESFFLSKGHSCPRMWPCGQAAPPVFQTLHRMLQTCLAGAKRAQHVVHAGRPDAVLVSGPAGRSLPQSHLTPRRAGRRHRER